MSDFGLATWRAYQTSVSKSSGPAGTVTHLPPESWEDVSAKPNFNWDMYGFAVMMWELFSGEIAYEGMNDKFRFLVQKKISKLMLIL